MAFQNFSEYYYCFNLLDIKMPNEKEQLKYYERWMKKYSEVFKDNDFTCVEWELRCQKSMREIFTASNFFIEAKKNLEMRCFSSYYFCLYYALFHAIYSVLFFDTQSNIYNLLDITHRNIINLFVGVFANSSKDILTKDIEELFKELKYKREYYSYVTPFNNLFDYQNDINRLEIALAQCFQLSSFHSLMVEKSYNKINGTVFKFEVESDVGAFICLFNNLFSKEDINERRILDDSVKNIKIEILKYGCKPQYIALEVDHMLDEFHTYDKFYGETNENVLSIGDIWKFILKYICS